NAVALQGPEVIHVTQLRAQLLQEHPVALLALGPEGDGQVVAEIRRDLVVIEQGVVHVEQEHDLARARHDFASVAFRFSPLPHKGGGEKEEAAYCTVLLILKTGSSRPATTMSVMPAITSSIIGSSRRTNSSSCRVVRFSRASAMLMSTVSRL